MAFNFRNKIPKVRFYGASEQEREQKNLQDNIVSRRLIGLLCFVIAVTSVMAIRLGIIQFKQADELAVKLEQYGTTTYTSDAPRGEIVDREYVKLVENTSVICATYYAPKKIDNDVLIGNQLLCHLLMVTKKREDIQRIIDAAKKELEK